MIRVYSGAQIVSIAIGVALVALVPWLIRKRRLHEETALLWLAAMFGLLLIAVRRDLLDWVAGAFGIYYSPSILLLGIIFVGILLALHFSVVISRLTKQNTRLAQELALLREWSEPRKPVHSLVRECTEAGEDQWSEPRKLVHPEVRECMDPGRISHAQKDVLGRTDDRRPALGRSRHAGR
jgi:hypothetical protein